MLREELEEFTILLDELKFVSKDYILTKRKLNQLLTDLSALQNKLDVAELSEKEADLYDKSKEAVQDCFDRICEDD